MAHETIEEAKARLAQEELAAKALEADEETGEEEQDQDQETDSIEESEAGDAEEDSDDSEEDGETEENPEDWMKGDEEESEVDNSLAANVRRATIARTAKKFEGRLSEQQDEIAKLREENERLKTSTSVAVDPVNIAPPERDKFTTEPEYLLAVTEWSQAVASAKVEAANKAKSIKDQQDKERRQIEAAVEQHYTRAASIAKASNIPEEKYKEADKTFRAAIDEVFPNAGDAAADLIISALGSGSERVTYNLGVNKDRRAKLQELLREDPKGMRAIAWLTELKVALKPKAPVVSQAKEPLPNPVRGKAGGKIKLDYDKAISTGNAQKAMDLRRKAKLAGADVSKW